MTKIAAIQMTSGSVVSANLEQAATLIQQAKESGAGLVLLPENFAFFAKHEDQYVSSAEPFGEGEIQQFLQQQAKDHGIYLVGGSVPIKASNGTRARAAVLVFNPLGECVGRYDKVHLFDVTVPSSDEKYQESDFFEPGDSVVVLETEIGRLGLCVCYDLRFPEMFRLMQKQGVEIILVPSAFTKLTGQAHWQALLQARAIENLSFVVAADQCGFHVNGRETYGHSMAIDPWGNVLDVLPSGAGVVLADINLTQQVTLRQQFPVLNHRKFYCEA